MRILLLEDEALLADAVCRHLNSHGFAVDAFSHIADADAAAKTVNFDAAVFDLTLPDGDSLNLIRKLRREKNFLPIIVVTARDQVSERIRGLESGADDYLVKPFDLDELVARLHAVIRRAEGNPDPLIKIGKYEINRSAHALSVDGKLQDLTAKEWAVLEKLIARPGTIISKESFEETLYSFSDEVESNTLEVYISRIRKKLGKEAIETIRGVGYRFNAG